MADAVTYCPKCQETLPEQPWLWQRLDPRLAMNSLSRADNKTYICNKCGTAEALADWKELPVATARRLMEGLPTT